MENIQKLEKLADAFTQTNLSTVMDGEEVNFGDLLFWAVKDWHRLNKMCEQKTSNINLLLKETDHLLSKIESKRLI